MTDHEIAIKKEVWKFIREYNHISVVDLENILETLQDNGFLNDNGKDFRKDLWKNFIKL